MGIELKRQFVLKKEENEMIIIYPVIFTATHDKKDTYLVEIPDLQGMTEGYGLEGACKMARDYIGGMIADIKDEDIPAASSITKIDVSKGVFADAGESFVTLIDLDLEAYRRKARNRAVRCNVSLPAWLNEAAREKRLNFSRVLQEALMEKLGLTR